MGLINGADVTKVWDNTATISTGGQAPHELGAIARIPGTNGLGDRFYVFVHNDTVTAITQGQVAEIIGAGGWSVQTAVAAAIMQHPAQVAGIVQRAGGLPADHYGWVQCWGRGEALAEAADTFALGDLITAGATTNGSVSLADDTGAVTNNAHKTIAVAREANVTTAQLFDVDICIRTA